MPERLPADRRGTGEGKIAPNEARAIAKEAYVYGYPVVDNYPINFSYFVDPKSLESKVPWSKIDGVARVFTPDDQAIQAPNSDTSYSMLGMELRAEPLEHGIAAVNREGRSGSRKGLDKLSSRRHDALQ